MNIPIPDVSKSVKRRFFRHMRHARRERQMQRAESLGLARSPGGMTVFVVGCAIPFLVLTFGMMSGLGYAALPAIPVFWFVTWWLRRAARRSRAPLAAAWRASRRRRRNLRRAKTT